MRRLVPILLLAVLVPAALAESTPPPAPSAVSVPHALRRVLPKVRAATGIAIRLPSRARFDVSPATKLYATGGGGRRRYDLELSAAPRCGGANACFVAAFTGLRAHALGVRPNVRLAHGLRGRFQPLSCGASCAPASITWIQRGVVYFLQARIDAGARGQRRAFVALANSAIRGGRR